MNRILLFFAIFSVIFILTNFKIVKISGDSMYPLLHNDSIAIVDQYTFKLFPLNKSDIYLFKVSNEEVLKKIKFFPNENVYIKDKSYLLKENEIFIIGENLNKSIDSREFGPINTKQILGKVVISF